MNNISLNSTWFSTSPRVFQVKQPYFRCYGHRRMAGYGWLGEYMMNEGE